MKQSEKLLILKDVGTILIILGFLVMFSAPVIVVANEVYDLPDGFTVVRWGVGIALSGIVIRIARFLWLW